MAVTRAQDESTPTEAPPAPMEGGDHHVAELQTDAQQRALAQALYSRALRIEMSEGFLSALPNYLDVVKVDPHFVELQVKIALYFLQAHDGPRALELLQKAALANPHSGEILAALAFVQQDSGHFDLALASAQAALVLDPTNDRAHRIQFEVLRDLNRLPEALSKAKAVLALKSTDAHAWMELARTYTELLCASTTMSKDQLSGYITPLYDRAFSLGDPSEELLLQRGEFVGFLGKEDEALKYFLQASQKGEPNAEIYIRVARLQSDLGKNKEALKSYEQAYELSPDLPLLREQLAYEYVLDGQESKAIPLLEAILRKSPTRSGIYSALGELYQKSRQLERAEQSYHEAILLDPTSYADYLKMAILLHEENRLKEAEKIIDDARNRFPSNARVAFYAAIVQRDLKNSQQALDLFAQAKLLADQNEKDFPYSTYFYELSLAQEEAGKPLQSEASLKTGLNLDPNNENLLNALAYLWAEQGKNLPKAMEYSKQSLQIAPDRYEFLDTLGWVYFKMGRFQDALPLLERAVSESAGEEEVLDHLAEVYSKLGQTKEALAALDKILAKTPDNAVIREKYEKLKKVAQPASMSSTSVRE